MSHTSSTHSLALASHLFLPSFTGLLLAWLVIIYRYTIMRSGMFSFSLLLPPRCCSYGSFYLKRGWTVCFSKQVLVWVCIKSNSLAFLPLLLMLLCQDRSCAFERNPWITAMLETVQSCVLSACKDGATCWLAAAWYLLFTYSHSLPRSLAAYLSQTLKSPYDAPTNSLANSQPKFSTLRSSQAHLSASVRITSAELNRATHSDMATYEILQLSMTLQPLAFIASIHRSI